MIDTPPRALAHSIPEAARMLGIGRTLAIELIARGELGTIRIRGRRLVPDANLQQFVEERIVAAAAGKGAA